MTNHSIVIVPSGLGKCFREHFDIVMEQLKVHEVCARKLSNGIAVIYSKDDERVDAVLEASLAKLPEFLANENRGVRLLATYRLEELDE